MPSASSSRIYVLRRQNERTATMVQTTGALDCGVTFTVDRNVCIQGIIIASQDHGMNQDGTSDYNELLECASCGTGMVLDYWLPSSLTADLHVDRRSMSSLINPSTSSVIASTASVCSCSVGVTTLLRHLIRRSCREEFNSGLVPVPASTTITATPSQWKDSSPM